MNKKLIVFALLVLAIAATEVAEEEDVLILTDDNFDSVIAKHEHILVEFYAPWCGHCKKLKPEYEKAAKALKQQENKVPLAKVDATEQQKLGSRFEIQGFPTLKFFVNGEPIDYNGGRTDKEIVNWINKRVGMVSTLIKDQAHFDTFTKENPVVVVYFGKAESDEHFATFKSVAMSYDKLAFGHVFDSEVTTNQKAQPGKIVLFKKFDEGRNDYEGAFTAAEIKKFVEEKSFATVIEFDDRAIEKIFQQGNPTIFLFHTKSEESTKARSAFEDAAKKLKGGRVLFSVSTPDDGHGHFQRLADYVGVNTGKVPALMLVHASGEVNKFRFEGDITEERIVQFVNNFNDNKLEKYMKSEEIPEKQEGPVRVLVGKNFEDEVINNNKDVLVKFYAPWCGHCKTLAPKWEAAAEKLKGNKNIVIAKIDSTANEVPNVSIRGFPTIKFYPAGNKQNPIEFDGDRSEEGIINWLKEKTTHPWVDESAKNPDL